MTIPTAQFGQTGHQSTRTLFGGAALGRVPQERADETLALLLERGVNHIDTAASYGDSELRIGPAYDKSSQLGPVVNADHRKLVTDWIQKVIDEGATLVRD